MLTFFIFKIISFTFLIFKFVENVFKKFLHVKILILDDFINIFIAMTWQFENRLQVFEISSKITQRLKYSARCYVRY